MGYNSWYDVECAAAMNETFLKAEADALVAKGLAKLGYRYVNLDDCWAVDRRGPGGTLQADPAMFPSGTLKPLSDYVHQMGLLFGTYTDRADKTCAGRPGALGHEALDARTYADWGVDYLKEDSCFAATDHAKAFAQYGAMRDGLNKTGRPIFFSLCGWNDWYAPVGASLGNSWRVGPDDTNWPGILSNIDIMAGLGKYAGPGGWNDPCLLLSSCSSQLGDCPGGRRVTELQTRAQFSMWAVLAAPLLISGSVVHMSQADLETYSNKEVISVNQDPLGKQGIRVFGGELTKGASNVWGKPLSDGSVAMVFINTGDAAVDVTCDPQCFSSLGFGSQDRLDAGDLWAPWRDLDPISNLRFTAEALAPHGGHLMLRIRKAATNLGVVVV